MAAAMCAPSPGGDYVGWQPSLTYRPNVDAGGSDGKKRRLDGGAWQECEHPADLRRFNGGHGHTGSSTNASWLTKQTWVVDVMKRWNLASAANQSGTVVQPTDVVRLAVECASPAIPQEQHAAWIAKVRTWVGTPEARNRIKGAAATKYREDMSRR